MKLLEQEQMGPYQGYPIMWGDKYWTLTLQNFLIEFCKMSEDAIDLGTCLNSRFPEEMHSWRAVSATTEFLVPLVEFRASPSTCQTSIARSARMSEIIVFQELLSFFCRCIFCVSGMHVLRTVSL